MGVQTERAGGVHVIRLVERIDSGNADEAETAVRTAVDAGHTHLLFDLSELSYMSSAGLRVILLAARELRGNGGRMALFGMGPDVRRVFEISGFLPMLQVHDDREAALAALAD